MSIGVPQALPVSYRKHIGSTYYGGYYDNAHSGWETRKGAEWSWAGGLFSYSGTTYGSGEISQTTNTTKIGLPFLHASHENDYDLLGDKFGVSLPYMPMADNGDRYRSAALRFKLGGTTIGFNMFTGDPGLESEMRETRIINGRETYVKNAKGDDPDKYRAGVAFLQFGPMRLGIDSERYVRHAIQLYKMCCLMILL